MYVAQFKKHLAMFDILKIQLPCSIYWFQITSVFRTCFHMRAFTCILPTSCCHWNKWCQILPLKAAIVYRLVYTGIEFQATAHLTRCYCKVTSRSMARLVAHPRIFRLFMEGKFDAYVLWPLAQRVQNWTVDRSTARDFMVFL